MVKLAGLFVEKFFWNTLSWKRMLAISITMYIKKRKLTKRKMFAEKEWGNCSEIDDIPKSMAALWDGKAIYLQHTLSLEGGVEIKIIIAKV